MKKSEFEKVVKQEVLVDGAKVVDINTTLEKEVIQRYLYINSYSNPQSLRT